MRRLNVCRFLLGLRRWLWKRSLIPKQIASGNWSPWEPQCEFLLEDVYGLIVKVCESHLREGESLFTALKIPSELGHCIEDNFSALVLRVAKDAR